MMTLQDRTEPAVLTARQKAKADILEMEAREMEEAAKLKRFTAEQIRKGVPE